eukprot:s2062_g6.t1
MLTYHVPSLKWIFRSLLELRSAIVRQADDTMSSQRNQKADRRRRSGGAGEMLQSPLRSYNEADAPTTPCRGSPQQKALVGSPSPETLCPQPRRPFPNAAAPSLEQLAGMPGTEEAACSKELKDLWSSTSWKLSAGAATPGRLPWENRPLSAVSTNAGATPSLDDQCRLQFSPAPSSAAPTPSQDFERYRAIPPSQVRKVFVGGIPQDFTQDDLCELFSQFGAVTKAWLQRHRQNDNDFGHASSQRSPSHRGFGFVIFQDASMVDELLGAETSCFMEIKDGRRIEVKRAKSSNDIIGERQMPHPEASKQAWSLQQTRSDQQHGSQPQPVQRPVQSSQFVPCASLTCGTVPAGGWSPMVWTGSVATGTAVPVDNAQSSRNALAWPQRTEPAPTARNAPAAPQMICQQVPPFSFPHWAGGAQSEEEKQKLVQLLQAAAPAYYAD